MKVRLSKVGEVVASSSGCVIEVVVVLGKEVEVTAAGAPAPKVVATDAPLPGRNNRLDICAVVYTYLLGS